MRRTKNAKQIFTVADLFHYSSIALCELAVLIFPNTLRRGVHHIRNVHEFMETRVRSYAAEDAQEGPGECMNIGGGQSREGREGGESGAEKVSDTQCRHR